ncbi:MAG: type I-C CRISPR-associated protein Cas8c/Csd1 [Anaerolineae bacterium]|nr:type I-C CRISPR-associated protein Cas8c/Csd1 [Anaerolineae bacterium]
MVLQALNRYYDILAADPESGVAPLGYSVANVGFAINLSPQGELLDVVKLYQTVQRGKKILEVHLKLIVPQQEKRSSGVAPNFLCDNVSYVLGISNRDETDPDYAHKRFEAFKELNTRILSQLESPTAQAVFAFLSTHQPATARNHPALTARVEALLSCTAFLVFRVEGYAGFVHDDPDIQRLWETYRSLGGSKVNGQCLVTGDISPISRLHPNIKGVNGANSSGAALVGFNAAAYESYGKEGGQGLNAPVSERAVFAYTTALNYLLSPNNEFQKFQVGDTTVVYWAESPERTYSAVFSQLFTPGWQQESTENETEAVQDQTAMRQALAISQRVKQGKSIVLEDLMQGLDGNTRFYVLGLAPNAARVSIRFFYTDLFIQTVRRIASHYQDMKIIRQYEGQPEAIELWQIVNETISKKSSKKESSPLLAGALLRSILNNQPYPAALYNSIINRVRADMDDEKGKIEKINYVRTAIIKAYLIRKYRNQPQTRIQEVLCMSLNEQSTNQAYLLGRLFAVLEKAQQEASGGNLNTTIKDRYFTSACASPATVFPVLLRLAQHHVSKAEYGYALDRRIQDILNLMEVDANPYPSHLTLDEQGIFILGYYHQCRAFYQKNEKETTKEEIQL